MKMAKKAAPANAALVISVNFLVLSARIPVTAEPTKPIRTMNPLAEPPTT